MGLGNFLIKKTAKSTANSIAKYVNSGQFSNSDEAIKAWANTRRNSVHLIMMIEGLANFEIANARLADTADIAEAMFYAEMDMEKDRLSLEVQDEISFIFKSAVA
jgi:hypothetical protein